MHVVVDAGTGEPPPGLFAAAERRFLVTRPCYHALRRATAVTVDATGAIIVHEPGRALRADDVAAALRVSIVAEVSVDPAVCRAVDAGLMLARMPRSLATSLRQLA